MGIDDSTEWWVVNKWYWYRITFWMEEKGGRGRSLSAKSDNWVFMD